MFTAILALLFGLIPGNTPETTRPIQFIQKGNYQLDTSTSRVFWKATKVLGGGHNGYLLLTSGNLLVNDDKNQSGQFLLNMNSIMPTDSWSFQDNQDIASIVKGKDFFAVRQYPSATMQVDKLAATKDPRKFQVSGQLTLVGKTQPISFLADMTPGPNSLAATAAFTIDRIRWGITHDSGNILAAIKDDFVENDIQITLKLFFKKS